MSYSELAQFLGTMNNRINSPAPRAAQRIGVQQRAATCLELADHLGWTGFYHAPETPSGSHVRCLRPSLASRCEARARGVFSRTQLEVPIREERRKLLRRYAAEFCEIRKPGKLRLAPQLADRTNLGSFSKRTDPDAVEACLSLGGSGVEVGSAAIAKAEIPLVSTLSVFRVGRRLALYEPEGLANDEGGGSEGSAGKDLTVRTVAETDSLRIDRGFELNRPAVTASVNVHRASLLVHCSAFCGWSVAIACRTFNFRSR